MSDSMKKFAELLSTNEEAKKELEAARSELEKGYTDAAIRVAGKHGITLSASDFESDGELSPEELKAVAGGRLPCLTILHVRL